MQHAVASLLHWLATPADGPAGDPAIEQLQRNALWLGFLMVPHNEQEKSTCEHQLGQWIHRLPAHVKEPGKGFAHSLSKVSGVCQQVGWWPLVAAKGLPQDANWMAPGVLVLDEAKAEDDTALHLAWRQWLQLFNTAQSLPGMWLVTASGLDQHDYDGLTPLPAPAAAQPSEQTSLNGAWLEVLEQLLDPLKPGMVRLAHAGAAVPEIGPELADDKGRVVADAEMIWAPAHLAVLRPDQADMVQEWTAQGWTVLCLDEDLTQCTAQPWENAAATALGLTIENQE